MKCISPCFYLKLGNSEGCCCNFSASRVHFLMTIVSLTASLLITTRSLYYSCCDSIREVVRSTVFYHNYRYICCYWGITFQR
ncbi:MULTISPECIES: hypothetical protein [Chlamydia]|uniref:Uncharacterized protein n=1 Tax=Chlamydophila parapsittaci TaxID=344886 RepID=A0ABX5VYC0_9CHLA|nr:MULTISPECIES: hypothetical protein [Chlamydia]QDE37005.1 hypothetical protein FI836_01580 [Chlamydophila parapsittaci]QHE18664.1 hypothetical protein GR632_01575 [Chlamydia psittaci]UOB76367.1 hypothetical protein MRE55_01610 [Chlamydia psittaci]USB81794.1 hypothetical protein NDK40_02500 [Chlamydia psittaci]UWF55428.1 hypothetical protein NYR56_01580 [Chlamydia psittaci]